MPTLAQTLSITTPVSVLRHKARRLGIDDIGSMISLAVARGCRHYSPAARVLAYPPSRAELTDEELAILLLLGGNPYEPTAIRCAAQLARSPDVDPARLAELAIREKTERVLAHIARAGIAHDVPGNGFWRTVIDHLPPLKARAEPELPHWSRFVSMPGRQRGGEAPVTWLAPET
jgi:hypothetical protein